MKTSCSDIWTECQSCSETEEEDDDEGETVAFSEAGGAGRGGIGALPPAPFSP